MVLAGPAGIGKSRLLDFAVREAVAADLATALGRATELDRAVPLTTLMAALRQTQPIRLNISRLSEGEMQFHKIDQVGEAIEDYARTRPLLIVIDDSHWADELSALALRVLVPALAPSPVLWLLGRRPVPMHSPSQDAVDWLISEGATELVLGPLPDDVVAELCGNVLGARPDATVLALADRGTGNPFLVEQLLTAMRDCGQIKVSAQTATVVGEDLPSSFLTAVDRRLRGLSPQARKLLDVGAVFGGPFMLHSAAGVIGRPAAQLVDVVKEAVQAGVLVDGGRHLAFRHDLLREAVYSHLSGPARAVLHREAAAVLRAENQPAVEVAEHMIRAGQHGDQAVKVLREAASQVAANAPGTAADLIIRALAMLDERDAQRTELVGEAVLLLTSAGRLGEARELGEAALRIGMDAAAEATLLLGLAESFKHSGHNQMVVELTGRGLARPGLPDALAAQLLAIRAHALLQVDELDAADQAGTEAVSRGTAAGKPDATAFGRVARSVVARARGHLDLAATYAHEAVRTADIAGGAARHRHPRLWWGWALASIDRFNDAEHIYAIGQQEANRMETRWSQPLWHFYRAALVASRGKLDDAMAWAEAGLQVAEQLATLQMTVPLHALMTQLAIRRGALEDAADHLQTAERAVNGGITAASEELWWARAMLQEATGETMSAYSTLTRLYDRLPHRVLLFTNDPGSAPFLVRLAGRVGAASAAQAVVAAMHQLADANPAVASIAGAACHATGLLQQDATQLATAVERLRASPRPLTLASALEDAAVAELAAGHRRAAVARLEEAHDIYRHCGAVRDACRARHRLEATGGYRSAGAPSGRPGPGKVQLTECELRVVRLVAEGLTNREIAKRLYLSRHTVDSHLRHVFTKLGVNSRVKLARFYLAHSGDMATG